jgi:hypothetical protein
VTQGAASLLLANLNKEKEQLLVFSRVFQVEDAVPRHMKLKSFLYEKPRDSEDVTDWRLSGAMGRVID